MSESRLQGPSDEQARQAWWVVRATQAKYDYLKDTLWSDGAPYYSAGIMALRVFTTLRYGEVHMRRGYRAIIAVGLSAAALGLLMSAQKPTSEELEQNFAAITTLRKAEWARAYAESGEQRRWPVSAEQEAHWRMDKLYSANAAMLPYVGVAMVTLCSFIAKEFTIGSDAYAQRFPHLRHRPFRFSSRIGSAAVEGAKVSLVLAYIASMAVAYFPRHKTSSPLVLGSSILPIAHIDRERAKFLNLPQTPEEIARQKQQCTSERERMIWDHGESPFNWRVGAQGEERRSY